ncbi:lytic transglycosylase domain-containing protein [Actibacterium sp. 188UL27-1]|nr:lytic transglycosylase domain-containing protein [Actibacterium sp. 188UL27-1]
MNHIRSGDWSDARQSAQAGGQVAEDIVTWHMLRKGRGSFVEYSDFLERNADWPGLALMRTQGEGSIPRNGQAEAVIAWFGDRVPETGAGVLRLIEAYRKTDQDGDAQALAVLAWHTMTVTAATEAELLGLYPDLLKRHHTARLDDLLWRNERTAARRMFPRVSADLRLLAEARLGLRADAPGVDGLIQKVPKPLQADPGLAWERFNWRVRKGRHDAAMDLLAERSTSARDLGRPAMWANWRRIYARRVLRDGDPADAYAIASQNYLLDGSNFSDLEWLSGYIALRFLEDPELALFHFDRFRGAVRTPISLGRAGYWQGRAHRALGDADKAREAFAFGAQYQTSYYGQLSADTLGLPLDLSAKGDEAFPDLQGSSLANSTVLQAGQLLYAAGERDLAERFLTHLVEQRPREEAGQVGAVTLDLGDPHIALMVAKRAARDGNVLHAAYFPIHELANRKLPVDPALALAIARRESEFNPVVVSPVGARGLMQVMPGTARDVARDLKIDYNLSRLTADPAYNVRLGTAYLDDLIDTFGDAPVLVAAGYNAGPGRPVRWIEELGDPRSAGVDPVDWVEMIPFRETRNYVMRVTESIRIYQARLGRPVTPRLTDLLKGS